MKLKCDAHKRRVVIGSNSFLHRNGDGSKCDSKTATIGDNTMSQAATHYIAPVGASTLINLYKGV